MPEISTDEVDALYAAATSTANHATEQARTNLESVPLTPDQLAARLEPLTGLASALLTGVAILRDASAANCPHQRAQLQAAADAAWTVTKELRTAAALLADPLPDHDHDAD